MATLRNLVTGSDVCTPSDGAGPSNAASSLVNAILGGRSKQQQQLHELPGVGQAVPSLAPAPFQPPTAAQAADAALRGDLPAVPGFLPSYSTANDVDAFLNSQYAATAPPDAFFNEFESIYNAAAPPPLAAAHLYQHHHHHHHPAAAAEEAGRSAVRPFLHAFFNSSSVPGGFSAVVAPLPAGALVDMSVSDKCRVRDRSTILARQVFADQGAAFADQQVGRLLHSLNINAAALPAGHPSAGSWDEIYLQQQRQQNGGVAAEHAASVAAAAHAERIAGPAAQGGAWIDEFSQMNLLNKQPELQLHQQQQQRGQNVTAADSWAEDFSAAQGEQHHHRQHQPGSTSEWVDEFRAAADVGTAIRSRTTDAATTAQQTKRLAETLAADANPKFQNSKFLQFVSKMSRGELIFEENGVKEVPVAAAQWANEYSAGILDSSRSRQHQQQQQPPPSMWGEEYASFQAAAHPSMTTTTNAAAAPSSEWAQEYSDHLQQQQQRQNDGDWGGQFAQGMLSGTDWAEQFSAANTTTAGGAAPLADWEEEYFQELEKLHSEIGPRSEGAYIMAANNPFLTDTASFSKGKDLFRRGVLTEAVLALEAECQRNPGNSAAWRLLGTVQAENDDDVQAIAALNRALAADPNDLDALLSLGVSHTNELEQAEALGYLREWVMRHPTHGAVSRTIPGPPDSSQAMSYVISLYEGAAAAAPQDADVHAALGVLCNLGRRYDGAVSAFRAALALRSQDYSLWNKLGATLANSARSADALAAYQKALELKPNYMRAWTNMGISLSNIGDYEGSARYYVRALALNRNASAVWGYLRTSLSCAAREDLMEAADGEDVDSLLAALPL